MSQELDSVAKGALRLGLLGLGMFVAIMAGGTAIVYVVHYLLHLIW